MTLPAHRYLERAKNQKPPYIWSFDIDDTVTAAPRQYARLATALKAMGDKIVCVTGHGPKQTREELLDELGFPYDEIVIVEPEEDGSGKAKALKALGAWFHFDNEVQFGPEIIKVCPVTFQYVEPPGDVKPKKAAQKAAKALKRSAAPPPPNYRVEDTSDECCGNCSMFDEGHCWGYGNASVDADHVCDSWAPDAR